MLEGLKPLLVLLDEGQDCRPEDGSKIYLTEKHRTAAHLFALPMDRPPVMLSKGDMVISDIHLSATRSLVGFAMQDTRTPQEAFVSKLSDADAEAAETQVWLSTAYRCGYLDAERHEVLVDRYRHICAQLVRMIDQADRWCNPPDRRSANG